MCHDRAVVELPVVLTTHFWQSRFNGATTARSWNWAELPLPASRSTSFNGATTARSWNYARQDRRNEIHMASMGPRPRGRGILNDLPVARHAVRASMGPRPRGRGI